MVTYTLTSTGRTWAGQKYNRTTGMWQDGGPDRVVEIHDDGSGGTLDDMELGDLIDIASEIADSERADVAELADTVADEITNRLDKIGNEIDGWDGEDAKHLTGLLNRLHVNDYRRFAAGLWGIAARSRGYRADYLLLPRRQMTHRLMPGQAPGHARCAMHPRLPPITPGKG